MDSGKRLVRALVFDMDGLLVDSEPLWFRVERAFAAERGGNWTHAMATECIGRGMAATLHAMSAAFGFEVDVERDAALIVDAFIKRTGELELKPGAMELLERARDKGVPIALASSSARRLIDAVLGRFSIATRFASIVSGESVAKPKPAPDIFLRAAEDLSVPPPECAVLEDSIAGVMAGRAAEMFVVAVPDPFEGAAERGFAAVADVIVPTLVEASERLSFG